MKRRRLHMPRRPQNAGFSRFEGQSRFARPASQIGIAAGDTQGVQYNQRVKHNCSAWEGAIYET
jgi:hypothetical protein